MEPEVLRKKQLILLDILKEVVKICDKHGLRYYTISGTLIGAVRHKGFIPWDDDIDIAMPREDYNRFIKIAAEDLPEHLSLITPESVRHFRVNLIKVQDVRTTCVADYELKYPDRYGGVNIDIMPLDGLPDPGFKRKAFTKTLNLLRALNVHKRFKFSSDEAKKWPWQRRLFNALFLPFRVFFPFTFYSRIFDALLSRCSFETSNYVYFSWLTMTVRIFDKKYFASTVKLDFEGFQISAPCDYHGYLTGDYGDYMTLPPESHRHPPHGENGILDLERPYTHYTDLP